MASRTQKALWQSLDMRHPRPLAHSGQTPPPQSTSVSLAFFTPSSQVGNPEGWQMPLVHARPEQHIPGPVQGAPANRQACGPQEPVGGQGAPVEQHRCVGLVGSQATLSGRHI
jgi:hypothetical protein